MDDKDIVVDIANLINENDTLKDSLLTKSVVSDISAEREFKEYGYRWVIVFWYSMFCIANTAYLVTVAPISD